MHSETIRKCVASLSAADEIEVREAAEYVEDPPYGLETFAEVEVAEDDQAETTAVVRAAKGIALRECHTMWDDREVKPLESCIEPPEILDDTSGGCYVVRSAPLKSLKEGLADLGPVGFVMSPKNARKRVLTETMSKLVAPTGLADRSEVYVERGTEREVVVVDDGYRQVESVRIERMADHGRDVEVIDAEVFDHSVQQGGVLVVGDDNLRDWPLKCPLAHNAKRSSFREAVRQTVAFGKGQGLKDKILRVRIKAAEIFYPARRAATPGVGDVKITWLKARGCQPGSRDHIWHVCQWTRVLF
ncbi:MAG: hypothetical protein M3461_18630 [Pseudomonadota bacterium]|nr:hypothetical protein [Pseudomonadota bacterium]